MGSRKYSKDQITGDIQRVAKLLKRNRLTCREYKAYGKICVGTILSIFGTWKAACKSSGLEIYLQHGPRKSRIKDSELIGDLLSIEQSHGKVTWNAISAYGKYSGNTIKRRFGNLENAMQVAREYSQSMQEITSSRPTRGNSTQPQVTINQNKEHKRKQTLAREPIITFCPFVHAPSNEIEVTMLFASLAERLGYWIISCNKSYPDCHAIKKVNDPNSHEYEHVIIEFEYRSSNFLDHQHNPSDCDLIVCWIDDDKDNRIPVEKLELRSIFKRLNEECERRISNLSF